MKQRLQFAAVIMGLVFASAWLVWSLASRYSPRDPYQDFLEPTQRFLGLALAMDSLGLGRLEAAPAAVRWALDASRGNAARMRALQSGLEAASGMRNGDGTVVFFSAKSLGRCDEWPLVITFSGPAASARITSLSAGCGLR
jgi:hypothetical protein